MQVGGIRWMECVVPYKFRVVDWLCFQKTPPDMHHQRKYGIEEGEVVNKEWWPVWTYDLVTDLPFKEECTSRCTSSVGFGERIVNFPTARSVDIELPFATRNWLLIINVVSDRYSTSLCFEGVDMIWPAQTKDKFEVVIFNFRPMLFVIMQVGRTLVIELLENSTLDIKVKRWQIAIWWTTLMTIVGMAIFRFDVNNVSDEGDQPALNDTNVLHFQDMEEI